MAQIRPEAGELEVRTEAAPETVFAFFADPERMTRRLVPAAGTR
jgi:uncharacterized protein YndB with AHSA1/START domain